MKTNVKVPIHVCKEKMEQTGEEARKHSWTDEELGRQIAALRLVTSYLRGRGDCPLLTSALFVELCSFEGYKLARESD